MKKFIFSTKKLLLGSFLFTATYLFAQTTYTVNNKFNDLVVFIDQQTAVNNQTNYNISSEITGNWGNWTNDDCFDGIDFRVKKGDFNSYANQWHWEVQFRNRYNNHVYISYSVSEPGTKTEPDHRTSIDAGSETYSTGFLLYSGSQIHVRMGYLRFGNNDSGAYTNCDK